VSPISPQQLREALCEMLSDPQTRRLIAQSALESLSVRGGSPETSARDVSSGEFGADCTPPGGDYAFPAALTVAGNVGIGTTGPGKTLDVAGSVRANQYFSASDQTLKHIFGRYNATYPYVYFIPAETGTGWAFQNSGGNNTITLHDNQGMSIGAYAVNTPPPGGLIVPGNVGIGTAEPGKTLDVAGSVRANQYFSASDQTLKHIFGRYNATYPYVYFIPAETGTGWAFQNSGGNNTITLHDNQGMSIGAYAVNTPPPGGLIVPGNVGIGTPEPAEKLEVAGAILSQGLNKIIFLRPSTEQDHDDAVDIRYAINNELPANGGIIMLTPGTYNIHTTISITKSGVKIRGYGGNRETEPASSTLLQWIVDTNKPQNRPVMGLGGVADYVQGIEIPDLAIDGAGGSTSRRAPTRRRWALNWRA
jgi:hypothetical protein